MYIEEQIQEILQRIQELEQRKPAPPEEWLTISETARRLGVSYSVIADRVQDGRIKSTKLAGHPRIPMSQFSADAAKTVVIIPKIEKKPSKRGRKPAEPNEEWAEHMRKVVFG